MAMAMAMAWRQILFINKNTISTPYSTPPFARFFSKSIPYEVKVGIPEFLNGIGKGVETHVAKLESEIGDFHKLLVTRTLKLKKLGVPCKHEADTEIYSRVSTGTMEASSTACEAINWNEINLKSRCKTVMESEFWPETALIFVICTDVEGSFTIDDHFLDSHTWPGDRETLDIYIQVQVINFWLKILYGV
ncbi:hypothetical protein G4B88_004054 [Cannabis sativa]|uniref:Small ribosomal subunit protein mS41 SAM domain-containing protein n=1 Tax=Cannabis sativa TaxID=3483 RepID=A0A7J6GXR0_CANSA|nr:hypothetical protein G4B88_004054 [Cannabis sativa]